MSFKEMMNEVFSKVRTTCEEILIEFAGAERTDNGMAWNVLTAEDDATWHDKVAAEIWDAFRTKNLFVDFDSLYSVSFNNFEFTAVLLYDAHEYKIKIKNANA